MKKIAYIGIDYHLNHVTLAVMIEGKRKFHDTIRPFAHAGDHFGDAY
jgi:hypothetical protein